MIVEILPRAHDDLTEIWLFVARDDEQAATRLVRRMADAVARLADFPHSGTPRPELGDNARSIVIGRYLAFYRTQPDRVEIVRIVHGARDLTRIWDLG